MRAGSWSSQAEPAHFLYCIIPQAVCSLCKQAFPPRAARPGRGCAPGLAAEARAYSAAWGPAPRPRPPRSPLPARPPPGRSLRTPGDSAWPQPLPTGGRAARPETQRSRPRRAEGPSLGCGETGDPSSPPRGPCAGDRAGPSSGVLPCPVGRSGRGGPKWGGRWTRCFLSDGMEEL